MMNKAKKKVIEAQAIEEIYTIVLDRASSSSEYAETAQKDLQELLNEEEQNEWRIDMTKQTVEEYKAKAETFTKLAEQLLKLM